ncbi:MAG: hypothetical protein FJ135_17570 [Deltaproteobacteria bacterium]|nr:hypothetical protein [Deltaproteobacteria bacterium]
MKLNLLRPVFIFLMFLPVCSLSTQAAAITYDLKTDWSDSQNPNGCWSYNYGDTPLTPSVHPWGPWGFQGPSDQYAWAKGPGVNSSDPLHTPAWLKLEYTMAEGCDAAIGDVLVHGTSPGISWTSEPSNVTWTSNLTCVINISGGVWYVAEFLNRSMDWALYVKGNLVKYGNVHHGDPYSRDNPFLFVNGLGPGPMSFRVVPGDAVRLYLTKAPGYYAASTVGVNLSINAVPAPTAGLDTLLLLE